MTAFFAGALPAGFLDAGALDAVDAGFFSATADLGAMVVVARWDEEEAEAKVRWWAEGESRARALAKLRCFCADRKSVV